MYDWPKNNNYINMVCSVQYTLQIVIIVIIINIGSWNK